MLLQHFLNNLCCCWSIKVGGYIIGCLKILLSCIVLSLSISWYFKCAELLPNYETFCDKEGRHILKISKEEFEDKMKSKKFY